MSQSPTTSASTPDVVEDAGSTSVKDGVPHAPVFITAAAMSPPSASISRRLIDSIRGAGAALHRPPVRRHRPPRSGYLEQSRMSREMDRL
jgi:hypothetical protein